MDKKINYNEIDEDIRKEIKTLNDLGFGTAFCCSSHYDPEEKFIHNIWNDIESNVIATIYQEYASDPDKRSIYLDVFEVSDNPDGTITRMVSITNTAYIVFKDITLKQAQLLFTALQNCYKRDQIKLTFEDDEIDLRIAVNNIIFDNSKEINNEAFLESIEANLHEYFENSYRQALECIYAFTCSVKQISEMFEDNETNEDLVPVNAEADDDKEKDSLRDRIEDLENIIRFGLICASSVSVILAILTIFAIIYINLH